MATPAQIEWQEVRGSYDDFEEGEYVGTLIRVDDIEANTGNTGWSWVFDVHGLEISGATWRGGRGGWKITQFAAALGYQATVGGSEMFNPDALIGRQANILVKRDKKGYLNVTKAWPMIDEDLAVGENLSFFTDQD